MRDLCNGEKHVAEIEKWNAERKKKGFFFAKKCKMAAQTAANCESIK